MNVKIQPGKLKGAVTPPPSKSQAHRVILAAALAKGKSKLENVAFSQDILATLSCVQALGARWEQKGERTLEITGMGGVFRPGKELPRFDCGESGSTLRFLIPIALAVAGGGVFTGRGRLMERPQEPYANLFREKGITWEQEGDTLTVRGRLGAGEYALPGNVSSQFFTGLLYALPLVEGESRIVPTTPVESRDYIAMTLDALAGAGVTVTEPHMNVKHFHMTGKMEYQAGNRAVESDWSQAAFWYAANFLGSEVTIQEMNPYSAQGDKAVSAFYWKLARPGDVELDVSQYPDLVPPLAVMAAVRRGTARLTNAARLRMKESDRLASVTAALTALGADIEEGPDSLTIHGLDHLAGGSVVDSHNDHRIAMMTAVAAAACENPVTLEGAECVAKSYPEFWDHYQKLGGSVNVL